MMFAATIEVASFVPPGKGLDGVNVRSCSQSPSVDPFILLAWMCFNYHVHLKEINMPLCLSIT